MNYGECCDLKAKRI